MAESVGKLVLEVLKKDCHSLQCSYRAGDSQAKQNKLADKITDKLKHRVADGNEVRELEIRVKALESLLKSCLASAVSRKDKTQIDSIKTVLYPDRKKG